MLQRIWWKMKEIIIINLLIYLIIAFVWYLIFTYQFNFRMTVNVAGETLQKDFKGIELAIICLLWIIFMPIAIKNILKNKEE